MNPDDAARVQANLDLARDLRKKGIPGPAILNLVRQNDAAIKEMQGMDTDIKRLNNTLGRKQ